MNRRSIGGVFCILAIALIITKYIIYSMIICAILSTGVYSWTNVIDRVKPFIGFPLNVISLITFLLGISFIVYAEIIAKRDDTK
jgi:hypothetical protein